MVSGAKEVMSVFIGDLCPGAYVACVLDEVGIAHQSRRKLPWAGVWSYSRVVGSRCAGDLQSVRGVVFCI